MTYGPRGGVGPAGACDRALAEVGRAVGEGT